MLRNLKFYMRFNKSFPQAITVNSFHEEFSSTKPLPLRTNDQNQKEQQQHNLSSGFVKTKYKLYKDEESPIIYDVEEEKRLQYEQQQVEHEDIDAALSNTISLERGIHGVFDIEDLVSILRKENAINIFVCTVPKYIKYVDYMCIVTGRSYRHMSAMAEYVRKIYKLKRSEDDSIPKIEGEKSRNWMALDLGNIALHIFSEETRKQYDLESLWSIGSEYDAECNKPNDPLIGLFEENSILLHDLKPKEIPYK